MRRLNSGVALLEVLVSLALLGGCGLALLGLLGAGLASERDARVRELTLASEDRVLSALTLLRRTELDRRLGRHPLGEFIVDVQRPESMLYRIALVEPHAPDVEDLVTVVFRTARDSVP